MNVGLFVQYLSIEKILEYLGNARTHSKSQIEQIARSISEFGFLVPVLMEAATVLSRVQDRRLPIRILSTQTRR